LSFGKIKYISSRGDHEELKKNFDDLKDFTERENDLRKNEIRSLEDKQQKDNQVNQLINSFFPFQKLKLLLLYFQTF